MELETTVVGPATVLVCGGRLNMVAAPGLRSAVQQHVAAGQVRIVVDLSAVAFIDSSGLGALIAGLKETRQAHGDLRIVAATSQVRSVLRLTNLDRVLRPYDSVEDATRDW